MEAPDIPDGPIAHGSWQHIIDQWDIVLQSCSTTGRVLLIPPDISRLGTGAGALTAVAYARLSQTASVDVLPALGTHAPMTTAQLTTMFGTTIPSTAFLTHNYRDVERIGAISARDLRQLLELPANTPLVGLDNNNQLPITLNRALVNATYRHIISIGTVAPHVIVGFSNHCKNILIGCGGSELLAVTHYYGARIGVNHIIATIDNPIRRLLNHVNDTLCAELPIGYALLVSTDAAEATAEFATSSPSTNTPATPQPDVHSTSNHPTTAALYWSSSTTTFHAAAQHAHSVAVVHSQCQYHTVVAYMPTSQYTSMWVANKAIYRLNQLVADNGTLIVIAPGVDTIAHPPSYRSVVQRYGYRNTESIINHTEHRADPLLVENLAAAAHCIHADTAGRYRIAYAIPHAFVPTLRAVGFAYLPLDNANRYLNEPQRATPPLATGRYRTADGTPYYFTANIGVHCWKVAL